MIIDATKIHNYFTMNSENKRSNSIQIQINETISIYETYPKPHRYTKKIIIIKETGGAQQGTDFNYRINLEQLIFNSLSYVLIYLYR